MFGELPLQEARELEIGICRIVLEDLGDSLIRYSRFEGEELAASRIIPLRGSEKVSVVPQPPINTPDEIIVVYHYPPPFESFSYLMIKLREPLVLADGESIDLYLEAPIKVGFLLGRRLIDIFPPERRKFALYGSLEEGIICRYAESDVYERESRAFPRAVLPTSISNRSGDTRTLEKIVIPLDKLTLYYKKDEAYYPRVEMVIVDDRRARVELEEKSPKPGLKKAEVLPPLARLGPSGIGTRFLVHQHRRKIFEMIWGY